MESNVQLLVIGGCVLGALQLVAGIALGMWLRKGHARGAAEKPTVVVSEIARRLAKLADEISVDAHEHRKRLAQASSRLQAERGRGDAQVAELVVAVIGEVVRSNQELESKLDSAESRLKAQASELETRLSLSKTDSLTKLPNRREFDERLAELMGRWTQRGEPFCLVLLDIDHFKKLNDEHGHLLGDSVLSTIADSLRSALRKADMVARYGGEEFALLLPNTTLDEAVRIVEKERAAVSGATIAHEGERIAITASAGVAAILTEEDATSLVARADAALYAAKAAGRQCAFLHDGVEARPVQGGAGTSSAEELRELIAAANLKDAVQEERAYEIPPDSISDELARTCDELRRVVEQRTETLETPA